MFSSKKNILVKIYVSLAKNSHLKRTPLIKGIIQRFL